MNVAASVRRQKEERPQDFCPVPRCLWRIKSGDRLLTPCANHPVPKPATQDGDEFAHDPDDAYADWYL